MKARHGLLVVLALSALLDAWGLRWGLPSEYGWAPDEALPQDVDVAVAQRFAHGWYSKYPPLHFAVLAAVSAPVRAAGAALGWPAATVHDARMTDGRVLSLLLAAGVLAVLHRCGRELGDPWAGVLAAGLLATSLPFVYYAKFANLDVPYLFWFALSLLFFLRALGRGRRCDFVLFAAAAAAAVTTKDQAYALYVLTVPVLVREVHRRRLEEGSRGGWATLADRRLALPAAIGAVALLVVDGMLYNPRGFAAHLRVITGPASTAFQMFDRGPAGELRLLVQIARHLLFVMGAPALVVSLVGVALALREPARERRLLATLVPAVSYVLFFMMVVLYLYDRFLLPVALVLSLFGGRALTRAIAARPRLGAAVTAAVMAWGIARAASVDVLLARDSRYAVEDWLRREVGPGPLVAAVGPLEYLPRLDGLRWRRLGPAVERLEQVRPDVVVVNADYARRAEEGGGEWLFYARLEDGTLGYDPALRYRAQPRWCLIDRDALRDEGPWRIWSNLDKVDPEIRVYRLLQSQGGNATRHPDGRGLPP